MPAKERLQGGDLNRAIAEIMNALLSRENISRRELASRLATSHTYLNNRLNGSVDFTITDVDLICEALGLELIAVIAAAEWVMYGYPPKGLAPAEIGRAQSLLPSGGYALAAKSTPYDVRAQIEAEQEEP